MSIVAPFHGEDLASEDECDLAIGLRLLSAPLVGRFYRLNGVDPSSFRSSLRKYNTFDIEGVSLPIHHPLPPP
jgi:hypothetical protein